MKTAPKQRGFRKLCDSDEGLQVALLQPKIFLDNGTSKWWVRLMVGSLTPFSRTSSNLGSSSRSIGLATTSRCLHHAHTSVAVNWPVTTSMVDLLSKKDLCSISKLCGLLVFCPIYSSFSHKNAL
ncbi:hypothetical protein Fmac_016754 [Flemingia macrophylla]|uniref:Uncharacterized protein n=1 Tax=Flemingia macrophylla TaxID=520843 RepID=A0ABD1MIC5_9FABA